MKTSGGVEMNFAMIMAGGSGTRFWPLSRSSKPKQFLPIGSNQPLLRATAERIVPWCGWEGLMVVASRKYIPSIRSILPELKKENLIVEPKPLNTAPAIGLAVMEVLDRDPDGVLVVLPADHIIRPAGKFRRLINAACRQAHSGSLVTLGVPPSRPETGYGYIHAGEQIRKNKNWPVYNVLGFTEKPDLKRAKQYVRSGQYFWNSGMFIFRADVMMTAFEQHMPSLFSGLDRARKTTNKKRASMIRKLFDVIRPQSIDFGVMEKASSIHMLPCDCFWSDVGSWAALPEVKKPDRYRNITQGDVLAIDSEGCILHAEKRMLACVGIKDLIVVETPHAILVCPAEQAQRVKQIVEELKRRKRKDVL